MIIFTHVAKTAGEFVAASVRELRTRRKGYAFKKPIYEILKSSGYKPTDRVELIKGHIPFGYHKLFKTKTILYVTFLRDPITRWVSSVRHSLRERRNNAVKVAYADAKKDPKKFFELCLLRQINYNIMSRQLSGGEDLSNIRGIKHKRFNGAIYVPHVAIRNLYSKEQMEEFQERSDHNIKAHYAFVGFYEELNDDIEEMCKKMKWTMKLFPKRLRRTRAQFFKVDLLDPEILHGIASVNEYDLRLYRAAWKSRKSASIASASSLL